MERAWHRQQAAEQAQQLEMQRGPEGKVWEVSDLRHFDRIHAAAGSRIVVLCAYSRSCGICKQVVQHFERMAQQVRVYSHC